MDDLANSSWTSVDDIITALTTEGPYLSLTTEEDYDYDVPDLLCDRSAGRLLRRRLEPPLFLLVALLGGLGNLAVVWLYLRRRGRSVTELYLLHLAAADLLFLASLPLWAAEAASGWLFGAALCRINAALYKVNLFSGALLLAAISVDRYVVIVRGARGPGRQRRRQQCGRLVCGAVWLLALVLAAPELAFARVAPQGWAADAGGDEDAAAQVCHLMPPPGLGNRTKVLVLSLQVGAGCCLPALVMACCYGRVAATLLRTRGFQKHRALRVLAAVVAAFLLTQLPFNGVLVLQAAAASGQAAPDCGAQQALDQLHMLLRGVAYLHACLNPLLYAFVGRRFRRELLQLLPRGCRRRPAAGASGKAPGGRSRSSSCSETSQALSL